MNNGRDDNGGCPVGPNISEVVLPIYNMESCIPTRSKCRTQRYELVWCGNRQSIETKKHGLTRSPSICRMRSKLAVLGMAYGIIQRRTTSKVRATGIRLISRRQNLIARLDRICKSSIRRDLKHSRGKCRQRRFLRRGSDGLRDRCLKNKSIYCAKLSL
jgi:hypothetical protein